MSLYAGKNRRAINWLKAARFDHPEWVPCLVHFNPATWIKYREELEEIVLRYPRIFPGYRKGDRDFDALGSPLYQAGEHVDAWGTVWRNVHPGLDSVVAHEPLREWDGLETWQPPDPLRDDEFGPRDWDGLRRGLERARARGDVAAGGLRHGAMYMRLYYLRGFENLMCDLVAGDPRLDQLMATVVEHNVAVVQQFVALGVERMNFGDDLGLQRSLPISPALWRRALKPCFAAMFRPCRDQGVLVYLHSDGHILEIIPDLIEAGVNVLNPQVNANGLEGLRDAAGGRLAMNVDLNRQRFPFATGQEIQDHVGEVYETLHRSEGGLMIRAACQPDVPLENIDAVCDALQRVCQPPLTD